MQIQDAGVSCEIQFLALVFPDTGDEKIKRFVIPMDVGSDDERMSVHGSSIQQ